MDMTALSSDELVKRGAPAVERLLALVNQEFRIPVDPENRAPIVAYGLFMNLAHQVHALILLRGQNADHVCAPLRRSVIEHAAFLLWLADEREKAVDALNLGLQYRQKKLMSAADKAGFAQDAETQAIVEATLRAALPSAETHLLHGSKLVEEYLGDVLSAVWHSESGFTHPSIHVVRLFSKENDEQVLLYKQPHFDAAPQTVVSCLATLFLGALALNSLMDTPVWEDDLREIADGFGFSMDLPRRPGAIP
jgi:hypothetical protein